MAKVDRPWINWTPGVLCPKQINQLYDAKLIRGRKPKADGSAFDLTLAREAWLLPKGAVKPTGKKGFIDLLTDDGLAKELEFDANGILSLRPKTTYLVRLEQRFPEPEKLSEAEIHGQATAKSSIGRLDVLARFILDGMNGYEDFNPATLAAGNGNAYLEITPLSFPIKIRAGSSLSQLRLFYGRPEDVEVRGNLIWRTVLSNHTQETDRMLSVNLEAEVIGGSPAAAFTAIRNNKVEIETWTDEMYEPRDHWKLVPPTKSTIRLRAGEFYILRSMERLQLPAGIAAYCRATDETIGEMRIHYAGFVHPYFGLDRKDGRKGTPLIFEVRGHDFPVTLRHGEKMARLSFYRMSDEGKRPKDVYNEQELKLSKFFKGWSPMPQRSGATSRALGRKARANRKS